MRQSISLLSLVCLSCQHVTEALPLPSLSILALSPIKQAFAALNDERIFDWPVDEAKLSRGFRPKSLGRKRRPHFGIDLVAKQGSPIYAAQDGLVIYTGNGFRGFGKMLMIEGRGGYASLYAHFSQIKVKEGQRVKKGTLIGYMGRTGRASGVHLHFEIRKGKGPVDPLLYLPPVKKQ